MTKFLCPFPWIGPCVTTSGSFRVCPPSQSSVSKGLVKNVGGSVPNIRQGLSAPQVLNSDSLKELRRKMMTGADVSDTCARCQQEEVQQLTSRRKIELGRFSHFDEAFVQQWTDSDGTLNTSTPISTVILRLGNKCNLACRMCSPSSSSAWYKEWLETKQSGFKEDGQRVSLEQNAQGTTVALPDLYDWTEDDQALDFIVSCGPHLERLHFSGGEPLLSRGHLKILKNLVHSGRSSNIRLEYNSNLTVLTDEVLDLWSKFAFVEIGISMDGPPQVNEYIRYPLRSSTFLKNLQKLDRSNVNGAFWFSATVQIYNILYLTEMQEWLSAQNFTKILPLISWHVLRAPQELSIFALPLEAKKKVADILLKSSQFSNLAEVIFSEDKSAHFSDFLKHTEKMDQYRGQSLKQFPELWEVLWAHSQNS